MADDHNFTYFPPCFMGEWQAAVPFAAVQMGCYALFDGWRWEKGGPWQLDQLEKNLKMHLYTCYIIYIGWNEIFQKVTLALRYMNILIAWTHGLNFMMYTTCMHFLFITTWPYFFYIHPFCIISLYFIEFTRTIMDKVCPDTDFLKQFVSLCLWNFVNICCWPL